MKKGDTVVWIENNHLVSGIVDRVEDIEIRVGDERRVVFIIGIEGYLGIENVYTEEQIKCLFENPLFKLDKPYTY